MAATATGPELETRDEGVSMPRRIFPAAAGISTLSVTLFGSFTTFGAPGLGLLVGGGLAVGGALMVKDAIDEDSRSD